MSAFLRVKDRSGHSAIDPIPASYRVAGIFDFVARGVHNYTDIICFLQRSL